MLYVLGVYGIVYLSMCWLGGECVVFFYFDFVFNFVYGCVYDLYWNGIVIDYVCEWEMDIVFRIECV